MHCDLSLEKSDAEITLFHSLCLETEDRTD
jgi:hypothetical protein